VSSAVVVDDHLLLRVLLGDEPSQLRPRGGRLITTGLWYHRLARALANPTVTGALSRSLGGVDGQLAAAAITAVIDLPETVGLASLRTLAWPMARLLADGARLNLMSLEALAAAHHHGAAICLDPSDTNIPLVAAAQDRGVEVRLVA